ncbi:MAG TPA: hypothetical protein VMF09_10825 [Solirubrobacteraceae bacterium]|nr:hypothetical protein [Solirubrobacteraceae bacterium]
MKRIRVVGVCIIAMSGMTAVLAGAAQAAPEYRACLKLKKAEGVYSNSTCSKEASEGKGKYEIGLAVGVTYTSKTGEAVLSTPDLGGKVICAKSKDKGKITGSTTDEDKVTLEKCTTEGKKCSSKGETGKKAGTVVTAELETKLVEKEGKPAVEYVSKSGVEGYQAEFDCEGLLVRTKGYTIGVITSPAPGEYSLKTDTEFAGEENLLTEVSIDGGKEYLGPFPSEEKIEVTDTNKEAWGIFPNNCTLGRLRPTPQPFIFPGKEKPEPVTFTYETVPKGGPASEEITLGAASIFQKQIPGKTGKWGITTDNCAVVGKLKPAASCVIEVQYEGEAESLEVLEEPHKISGLLEQPYKGVVCPEFGSKAVDKLGE